MKYINLSLPDHIYRRVRMKAAERDTSVNALVRDFLVELTKSDFNRRKRLQEEGFASVRVFRGSDRLSREEIHDRRKVR